MKKKTQDEKNEEYFIIMEKSIREDLTRGRHPAAIMGSINRCGEWWENKFNEILKSK